MVHSPRALEIEKWKTELTHLLSEVELELRTFEGAKEECERALEALTVPHDITVECLALREARRKHEAVRDPVEHSLKTERQLVEKHRGQFR